MQLPGEKAERQKLQTSTGLTVPRGGKRDAMARASDGCEKSSE